MSRTSMWPIVDQAPASTWQERFFHDTANGKSNFHLPVALRLHGRLDRGALHDALTELVHRHESLRTTFQRSWRGLKQVVRAPHPCEFQELDRPPGQYASRCSVNALVLELADQEVPVERSNLFTASLIKLGSREHVVVLTMHHLIADGWSCHVLTNELRTLYAAQTAARPPSLPELRATFRGHVRSERVAAKPASRAYWDGHLSPVEYRIDLPVRPPTWTPRIWIAGVAPRLGTDVTRKLSHIASDERASLGLTAVAAVAGSLESYSTDSVTIGVVHANRYDPELAHVIGFFADIMPIRIALGGGPSFRELLRRVRRAWVGALAHRLPLAQIVNATQRPNEECDLPCDLVVNYLPRASPLRTTSVAEKRSVSCDRGLDVSAIEVPLGQRRIRVGRRTLVSSVEYWLHEEPEGGLRVYVWAQEGTASRAVLAELSTRCSDTISRAVAQPDRPVR